MPISIKKYDGDSIDKSIVSRTWMDFLSDLGRRITQSTDDHHESAFLFSATIRFNSTLQCEKNGTDVERHNMGSVLVPYYICGVIRAAVCS